jgi:hypothetical protein
MKFLIFFGLLNLVPIITFSAEKKVQDKLDLYLTGDYLAWETFEGTDKVNKISQNPSMQYFLEKVAFEASIKKKINDLNFNEFLELLSDNEQQQLLDDIRAEGISEKDLENIYWEITDSEDEVNIKLVEQFVDPRISLDEEEPQWRIQVYGGITSIQSMLGIMAGDAFTLIRPSGVIGVEVSKAVIDSINGTNWQVDLGGGVSQYLDTENKNGTSVNMLIRFTYNTTVYGNRATISVGEGLSYASTPPVEEDENEHGEQSKLMNYITIGTAVNLGDLFKKKNLKNCSGGVKIVHRSGIFGTVDAFNNIYGGSNFMTGTLECKY